MDVIERLCLAAQSHRPIAVVLGRDDYDRAFSVVESIEHKGQWSIDTALKFRGVVVMRSDFHRSYIVEDTPDGPLAYMI